MPKKKVSKKSSSRARAHSSASSPKKKHILFKEIPQLHALTVVFYILLLILFITIYYTRFV